MHCWYSSTLRGASLLFATLLAVSASGQDRRLQQLEDEAVRAAVQVVAPTVVQIETFGGLEQVRGSLAPAGPTTGLIVSEDGFILSSAFNFIQQPASILVSLPGGRRAAAEIVARDRSRMLVLLKVNTEEPLPVAEFVGRDEMAVGQWTIAVGKTFSPEQANMSVGVLSAKDRIWGRAIQTDAKISPSNYGGPLIDIRGRVLGILVPLSPEHQSEVAGSEWYDSGIGFAVPVTDLLPHLEQMKAGEDLHPGLLGIRMQGNDIFADPPVVASCQATSPAYDAGIRAGDRIMEADGVPLARQAQLRHILGAKYAGDLVRLVVQRDEETWEVEIELAESIEPYEYPFLGILPMRDAEEEAGVVVRYVYSGSPSAEAGLQPEDRILEVAGEPVADASSLRQQLASFSPGSEIKVSWQRGEEQVEAELALSRLPTEVPDELPPAVQLEPEEAEDRPPVGAVELRVPEEPNECFAYIPDSYHPEVPHGLVVWLHPPGARDRDALLERWREACREHRLILLAPRSEEPQRWMPTEVDVVRKMIEQLMDQYTIDESRLVVHGHQAGGAFAYLVAFQQRELVRGVAVLDAPLPRRIGSPENDPLNRLDVFSILPANSSIAAAVRQSIELLEGQKFPVTELEVPQGGPQLPDDAFQKLLGWIDTLDRI